jgi:hypothetical protein
MDDEQLKLVGVLALVIVVLGAFAAVINGRLAIGGGIADTDGEKIAATVNGLQISGGFRDPEGESGRKVGELYDRTVVHYAWFEDGLSQEIVVQARINSVGISCPPWVVFEYRYDIKTSSGASWLPFYQDEIPNAKYAQTLVIGYCHTIGSIPLAAHAFEIDGFTFCTVPTTAGCPEGKEEDIPDGAALRVSVFGNGNRMFKDEVDLRSAVPEGTWERGAYKTGETACARWEIPTTTYTANNASNPAYFGSILNMNTGLAVPVWDRTPLTTTSGRACVEVTDDMFSNILETCQNRLRFIIYSPIIVADQADTAVQSEVEIARTGDPPEVTEITFNKPEYQEGDTIVVTWKTEGEVTKVHVTIHIGGLLLYDRDIENETSVSVVASRAGIAEVEVTAYNRCTPSSVRKEQATVGNVFPGLCELFPDAKDCADENAFAILVAALAVIALLVLFFLSFYVFSHIESLPTEDIPLDLLIPLGITIAAALAAINAGWLDALLGG